MTVSAGSPSKPAGAAVSVDAATPEIGLTDEDILQPTAAPGPSGPVPSVVAPSRSRTPPPRYTPQAAAAREADANAAAAGRAQAASQAAQEKRWPETLPPRNEGLAVLTGAAAPPAMLLATTQSLLGALSLAELSALKDPSVGAEFPSLREAAVTRWRLACALALRPTELSTVSQAGLDALLAEADASLSALRSSAGMAPELRAGFNSAKTALVRDAVELAGVGQALSKQAAAASVQQNRRKYRHVETKITRVETVDSRLERRQPERQHRLTLVFSGVVIAALLFHGARLFGDTNAPPPVIVPEGLVGRRLPDRPVVVLQDPELRPISDERLGELELIAHEKGEKVVRISSTQVWMGPAEALPASPAKRNRPMRSP